MTNLVLHARRVASSHPPVRIATLLADDSTHDYVVYERPDEVCCAVSDGVSVIAYRDGAEFVVDGERHWFAAPEDPIGGLSAALRTVPWTGWRAYGWASFELAHVLHRSATIAPTTPLVHLTLPRHEIRLMAGEAILTAPDETGLDALERRLRTVESAAESSPAGGHRTAQPDIAAVAAAEYRTAVDAAINRIRDSHLDKVILSRVVPVETTIDLAATFLHGRQANTPARSFLVRLGGWEIAGFSPEIVVTVTASGGVTLQPLAGTRALLGVAETDAERRSELLSDTKEVFEHAISVHLSDHELRAVCAPESVRIGPFMSVSERGSVQHLASELSGQLAPGRVGWDAFAAVFPAVTASGVPKAAACATIRQVECSERGPYGGAVLTVDADGRLDAALVLRSVFRHAGRTWLRAGAGIVSGSTPERELEETREKLLSVSRYLTPGRADRPMLDTTISQRAFDGRTQEFSARQQAPRTGR